jgi:hypothetical protein
MDSCIGGIIARGGTAGLGARFDNYDTQGPTDCGGYGVGATGGRGEDGDYNISSTTKYGSLGKGLSTNTKGYAQIWRIG